MCFLVYYRSSKSSWDPLRMWYLVEVFFEPVNELRRAQSLRNNLRVDFTFALLLRLRLLGVRFLIISNGFFR